MAVAKFFLFQSNTFQNLIKVERMNIRVSPVSFCWIFLLCMHTMGEILIPIFGPICTFALNISTSYFSIIREVP